MDGEAGSQVPEESTEITKGARSIKATYADLVPHDWNSGDGSWVWVSCYHAMRIPREALAAGQRKIEFPDAIAILYYGSPIYIPKASIEICGDHFLTNLGPGHKRGSEGSYLSLILRYQVDIESDYEVRVRELTLRSLITVTLGENVAYQLLFENAVMLGSPKTSHFSDTILNPETLGTPNISEERLKLTSSIWSSIEDMEEHAKNRVKLSLRWNGKARGVEGLDEFISRWVALEALGMSDRNNIYPLEETLAKAYGTNHLQAKEDFGVGRLFGFRSRILHHGLLPSIHARLLDYLQALYKDILWAKLGLPCERAAETILQSEGFDLKQLLREK
jgi:hypothetical protein